MRPTDTRPIVISAPNPTGRVFISSGTSDDMREAKDCLEMMLQVVQAALTVRRLAEANKDFHRGDQTSGDDIPF